MDLQFELTDQLDEAAARQILDGLIAYNSERYGPSHRKDVLVTVRDPESSELLGGLRGMTHFKWLYVQQLWVANRARGGGVGSRLIRMAEVEARQRGCVGSYLDTFSFQALEFYRKLGYAVFGKIPNFPEGHERLFLCRHFE